MRGTFLGANNLMLPKSGPSCSLMYEDSINKDPSINIAYIPVKNGSMNTDFLRKPQFTEEDIVHQIKAAVKISKEWG